MNCIPNQPFLPQKKIFVCVLISVTLTGRNIEKKLEPRVGSFFCRLEQFYREDCIRILELWALKGGGYFSIKGC